MKLGKSGTGDRPSRSSSKPQCHWDWKRLRKTCFPGTPLENAEKREKTNLKLEIEDRGHWIRGKDEEENDEKKERDIEFAKNRGSARCDSHFQFQISRRSIRQTNPGRFGSLAFLRQRRGCPLPYVPCFLRAPTPSPSWDKGLVLKTNHLLAYGLNSSWYWAAFAQEIHLEHKK